MALAMRNFKKLIKKYHKKDVNDKKKPNQRRCYECKELGHYIADCPKLRNKEKEEKKYNEKSKDFKKKYQGRAHVGEEWECSHEDSDKEGMASLAVPKSKGDSSTISPMMRMALTFAPWQEATRYKNHPPPLPILPQHLVV